MKLKIFFIFIFITAAFLRLSALSQLPGSYTPDEVAQGYTAYSILKTGKDEWGNSNIFNLRSFGDFKPPLQTLLMIPSIKTFGLTPFAIRFPNALLSSLAILTTFLFIKALTKNNSLALISVSLLAFSPWHLPMSRLALEANLTVFIITLASWLLLISRHRPWLLILSAIVFSLNIISYHSAKYFTPVYIVLLCLYHYLPSLKFRLPSLKLTPFLLSFALLAGFFVFLSSSSSRISDIAIFNPTDNWQTLKYSQYTSTTYGLHPIITRVFNNKLSFVTQQFLRNYFSVFSPQFLFTKGAGETTYGMLPGFGVLGLTGTLGLLFSLFYLKNPRFRRLTLFLIITILIAAVPASIAKSNYSANRLSVLIPFIQILSALGLYQLISQFNKKYLAAALLVVIFTLDSLNFLQAYFFQGNSILADGMLYGHRQANLYITNHPSSQVIYSRKTSEPQAYVLFFQQIDPRIAQSYTPDWMRYVKEGKSFIDQMGNYEINQYHFREINFPSDSQIPNTILVGRPEEIPAANADVIIYSPDPNQQKPLFHIYNTQLHLNEIH